MNIISIYVFILVFIQFSVNILCIEPISLGLGAVGVFASSLYFVKRNTYCKFAECCNDDYITPRLTQLRRVLDEKLYGQHLAKEIVTAALAAHFDVETPEKALTLSFHGWPGSGKNYVTRFIKEYLYKEGAKSQFVHHFTARIHFPLDEHVQKYQENLQQWIKGNVSQCARSLFIFDEVDKMPEGVLNAIKPMIDHFDYIDQVDYRKSIFIFLSNTGSTLITEHLLNLWRKGVQRINIELSDFENLIKKGAFNEKGGFSHSDTIKSNLIDHYIPFFPMEKEHVESCVIDQFKLRGIAKPKYEHIKEAMGTIEWGPDPEQIYSTTGCKRLSQKVPIVIRKYANTYRQH